MGVALVVRVRIRPGFLRGFCGKLFLDWRGFGGFVSQYSMGLEVSAFGLRTEVIVVSSFVRQIL